MGDLPFGGLVNGTGSISFGPTGGGALTVGAKGSSTTFSGTLSGTGSATGTVTIHAGGAISLGTGVAPLAVTDLFTQSLLYGTTFTVLQASTGVSGFFGCSASSARGGIF